ncbi:glycosyltransferase family 4 protein [Acuticoccus sp. M5D2P5]|uniref:glycosyltransferase family 4 protein n=1 Tax=Acuticoccus kalidii TaxID=2910977 RepID=UPI001F312564|nr:glycosyltransferase family 4 protein [Acuticoccus kalidii]MCF3934888.1 glycosyltransferase family 4 protein [Acuticoccus kalidii]
MRIAQIAPLAEAVPPRLYGGTERIVSYLTEELVREGHEVTLFASGDSTTAAQLVPGWPRALRLDPAVRDMLPYHVMLLDDVRRRAESFDILHFHIDYLHLPMLQSMMDRTVTTLHGRLDLPDLKPLFSHFRDAALVSISNDQRRPLPEAHWVGTVYHGLPRDRLPYSPRGKDGYLAFLGRISPEKGPDTAIEVAVRTGLPLKIAAKIDPVDQAYWDEVIAPMVKACPNVDYIGEVDERRKAAFMGEARALLFPIDWPEPFGLVMIEAMSCGTPTIALDRGAVSEILVDGESGFVVEDVDAMVAAVARVGELDRRNVRRLFEERFTARRMARDYLAIYRALPGAARLPFVPLPASGSGIEKPA